MSQFKDETIIHVENLRKNFYLDIKEEGLNRYKSFFKRAKKQEIHAVDDINFEVKRGECLAFIGPNGAGKSTTIKILTGILHPTSGNATVLNFVPWKDRKALSFKIGSVFGQKSLLWLHLPPADTFNLFGKIFEMDNKEYEKRRDYLTEVFDLKEIMHIPVRKLSLGQRMRCEIAAGLLHKPEVIFLDEPTIGLDPVVKSSIRRLIKTANEEDKVTVFLTSHDTGDIEKICQRAIIINKGQSVYDGTINQLRRNYLHHKTLAVKVTGNYNPEILINGAELLKNKNGGAKLKIDVNKTSIEQVIKELMNFYSLEDITISDHPLEDVISEIYQS